MSQRETITTTTLNQWRGVDQRSQATLVKSGFFTDARAIFFGLGDNAERIPGKRISGKLPKPIFNIWQFGQNVLVQTYDRLSIIAASELTDFEIHFTPEIPAAPTLSSVSYFTLTVTLPALSTYAVSLTLQRSLDGSSWTTIGTGLAGLQVILETGLTDATLYYYRVLAVNPYASVAGPSASTTTPARLPDAPVAPTFTNIQSTSIDIILPALPAFAVTLNLQSSLDDVSWTTIDTGLAGGAISTDTPLTPGTIYYYRAVAVNTHGTTNGPSASVTASGTIEDESGVTIQDENNVDIENN